MRKFSDITVPLDRSVMAALADVIDTATRALTVSDHARALETVEAFFWQLCDDYLNLLRTAHGAA